MLLALLAIGCGAETKGDPVVGEEIYGTACTSCHGPDGDLGVETSGVPAADLNEEVPESSDEELADVIQNGEGVMAGTGLDDTETADVIAYLREKFGG